MLKRNKTQQFTEEMLTNLHFQKVQDGGETYFIYERPLLNTEKNYLITNDYSSPENDSWFVDYGYTSKYGEKVNCLANLTENLVVDFIKGLNIGDMDLEEWFEKLITREY